MNSHDPSKAKQHTLATRAEAAAWLARLRGPNRNSEVEKGFRCWMQASPEHQQAFESLSERVEIIERLRTRPLPAHWRPSRRVERSRVLPGVALAASVAIVAFAGLWYYGHSVISTNVGEQRTLALRDGTHVYLNTDTRVTVRYSDERRYIELKSGEALFEVARHPAWPFVVRAGDRQITALGTSFIVGRDSKELSVILVNGKVSVAPAAGAAESTAVALAAGERLTLATNQSPKLDRPEVTKMTAWRQGQVALDNMSLSQAVREMNRYSTQELVVEVQEAGSLRVGGFFRMGDSTSFAHAVAATYGFRVIEEPDRIILVGAPLTSTIAR